MLYYHEVRPFKPVILSHDYGINNEILKLEFYKAEKSGELPINIYDEHLILFNPCSRSCLNQLENKRCGKLHKYKLGTPSISITPAGMDVAWAWSSGCYGTIMINPNKLNLFAQSELGITLSKEQLKDIPFVENRDLSALAAMLMNSLNTCFSPSLLFQYFSQAFLIKIIQNHSIFYKSERSSYSRLSSKQLDTVLSFIIENHQKKISVEEIANTLNMSKFHFSRLFKSSQNISPYEYLLNYRIEKAKKLLLKNNTQIIQVATECGFNSQAYFCRLFKASTGLPPSQWKKSF